MGDSAPPGVLLRGADGSQFFIPHTYLSQYAVQAVSDDDEVGDDAPTLIAFAVQRQDGEDAAAFMPMPEGDAAAFMPMPEG